MRFLIAILAGIGLGLLYGWVINPVQYVDSTIENLRFDYQTDYVLMIAEAYPRGGDIAPVLRQLNQLGAADPEEHVQAAILNAERLNYPDLDIERLRNLLEAIQATSPIPEGGAP
jgi:hypothetical protein